MNSEYCKTSCPYRLLLNLINKIDMQKGKTSVALSNLNIYYTWKSTKSS